MDITDDLYQEIILEEFSHPQHFGVLEEPDATLPGINPSCGDALKIFVKLDPTKKKITELRWQGEGCAISIAAMSVLAQKINTEQLSLQSIKRITQKELEKLLGLKGIASGRTKCLMLGLHTLQTSSIILL